MQTFKREKYYENIIHENNNFPFNIYPCLIPRDFIEVPLHWHKEMEIIYIKKGKGIINLDFKKYNVTTGDIVIVKPEQLHGINQLGNHSMDYENIIFSLEMFYNNLEDSLYEEFFNHLKSGNIEFNQLLHRSDSNYIKYSTPLDNTDDICSSFAPGYKLALKSQMYSFFYSLFVDSKIIINSNKNYTSDRMKKIIKYIENNYQNKISIEDAAKQCNIAPSSFMRFFKNNTKTSFIDYLNNYRLSIAAQALQTKDASVTEIATNSGFDNISYFNRMFKTKYHMTPGQYRKSKVL